MCLKFNPLHPRVHCSKFYSLARWFWKRGLLNFGNIFSLSLYYFPLKKDLALHCTNWSPFQTFLRNSISKHRLGLALVCLFKGVGLLVGQMDRLLTSPDDSLQSPPRHDSSYLKQRKSLQHGPPIQEGVTSLDWTGITY